MWPRLLTAALGVWLMVAPHVLGYGGAAAASDRIVGPLVASVAIIAVWEVARGLRWAAVPAAVWLLAAPWGLPYEPAALVNSLLVGAAIAASTVPLGRRRQRFGGGWPAAVTGSASGRRSG